MTDKKPGTQKRKPYKMEAGEIYVEPKIKDKEELEQLDKQK